LIANSALPPRPHEYVIDALIGDRVFRFEIEIVAVVGATRADSGGRMKVDEAVIDQGPDRVRLEHVVEIAADQHHIFGWVSRGGTEQGAERLKAQERRRALVTYLHKFMIHIKQSSCSEERSLLWRSWAVPLAQKRSRRSRVADPPRHSS
jgi:hypothetical protein